LVELEERQIDGIRKALTSIDADLGVAHDDVEAGVASWDIKDSTASDFDLYSLANTETRAAIFLLALRGQWYLSD